MGSGQSSNSDANTPKTVRIDRSEIPEAYRNVRVSQNVYERILENNETKSSTVHATAAQTTTPAQQEHQRSGAAENSRQPAPQTVSAENIEEAKRVFRETVDKVEKQFMNYHRENVCADNEKEIIGCLAANTNQVLKCDPLWLSYDRCIKDFHAAVLKEKTAVQLPKQQQQSVPVA